MPNVAHVVGIDVSPKALRLAQQHLQEHPRYGQGAATLHEGDFLTDPTLLLPESLDLAIGLELFDILPDGYAALGKIYTGLKPGGHLIGSWLSEEGYYKHFKEKRGRAVVTGKIVMLKAMPKHLYFPTDDLRLNLCLKTLHAKTG